MFHGIFFRMLMTLCVPLLDTTNELLLVAPFLIIVLLLFLCINLLAEI